jgi:HPt (histidine-containing phosphotransfer) domain-containing protein
MAAHPAQNPTGQYRSGVIDREYLARFTLGSAALEKEVLELFSAQLPLYVQQLREAATARLWREAAHTIKGSAAAVGAKRLENLTRLAEQLDIESPTVKIADQRQKAVAAIAKAAEEARREIASLFAAP